MKNLVEKIVAPLVVAGIISNLAIWFQFGERLARIETKIEQLQAAQLHANHSESPLAAR